MSAHRKVTLTSEAGFGKLLLGDQDISNQVRACTIRAEAGDLAQVTVELAMRDADFDGDAIVKVGDETAALLTSLGWTPPCTP